MGRRSGGYATRMRPISRSDLLILRRICKKQISSKQTLRRGTLSSPVAIIVWLECSYNGFNTPQPWWWKFYQPWSPYWWRDSNGWKSDLGYLIDVDDCSTFASVEWVQGNIWESRNHELTQTSTSNCGYTELEKGASNKMAWVLIHTKHCNTSNVYSDIRRLCRFNTLHNSRNSLGSWIWPQFELPDLWCVDSPLLDVLSYYESCMCALHFIVATDWHMHQAHILFPYWKSGLLSATKLTRQVLTPAST